MKIGCHVSAMKKLAERKTMSGDPDRWISVYGAIVEGLGIALLVYIIFRLACGMTC